MSFELDYTELDYVRRALSIPALNAMGQRITENTMIEVRPKAENVVEAYPPMLSGQRYIRTDTFLASTYATVNALSNGAQLEFGSHGAIQNGRRYDQYLKDARQQADIHKGRWRTLDEDADIIEPMVLSQAETELTREGFV